MSRNKFNIGDKIFVYSNKTFYEGTVWAIKIKDAGFCYSIRSEAPFIYKDEVAEWRLGESIPSLIRTLKEEAYKKYATECQAIESAAHDYDVAEQNRQKLLKYRAEQEKKNQTVTVNR